MPPTKVALTSEMQEKATEIVRYGGGINTLEKKLGLSNRMAVKARDAALRDLGDVRIDNLSLANQQAIDDELARLSEEYIKRISRAVLLQQKRHEVDLGNNPVAVAFMADVHIGGCGVAYDKLEADIKTILETDGLYVVLAGDMIENHIRHLSAVLAQRMSVGDQWAYLARVLDRLQPKIVAIVGGNHEAWTVATSGYNPLRWMSKVLKKPYKQDEITLDLNVGKQTYRTTIRHKYRFNSFMNPSNAVKQLWAYGDEDFDIGVVGHDHSCTTEPFYRHRKERWVVRPGTYQLVSGYAQQEGFHGAVPVTPAVLLMPEARDIMGFNKLDWAAMTLKALRK